MSKDSKKILVAEAVAPQGIKGQVKLKTFTESPENIINYNIFDDNNIPIYLELISIKKGSVIVEIQDVDSRDLAEKYVGTKLYIDRQDLPQIDEDEFYHEDLLGLRVKNQSGQLVGKIKALYNFGAGDIIEISLTEKKTNAGKEKTEMFAFKSEIFPKIDLKLGEVLMNLPDEIILEGVEEKSDV